MSDSVIITYADLKRAFFRHTFALKIIVSSSFFLTFVFLVTREPQFLAETTFQQSTKATSWHERLPKSDRFFPSYPIENHIVLMMESGQLLKPIIEKLGLQMVAKERCWNKWVKTAQKNILYSCNLSNQEQKDFVFSHIHYEQQEETPIFLQITSANTYQILSYEKKPLVEGRIAEQVSTPLFSIRVDQFPKTYKLHNPYYFTLTPWEKIAIQMRSKLDIRPNKLEKKILKVQFSSSDSELSTKVIAHIIQFYKKFAQSEMKQLLKIHKNYIEKREEDLLRRFDILSMDYTDTVKKIQFQGQIIALRKEMGICLWQIIMQIAEIQEMRLRLWDLLSRDQSVVFLHPLNYHLMGYSLLASCIGLVVGYLYFVSKMIIQGVPVSHEGLMADNIYSCGYLSAYCGRPLHQLSSPDLQTLRKICQFIGLHKDTKRSLIAALIMQQHASYISSLVSLLVLRGAKLLLVNCSFEKHVSEPTFVQYLEGSITDLPIQHLGEYDQLLMGYTTYGFEWLAHPKFSSALLECRQYDLILLTTHASAKEIEAHIFCRIADCVIVTTQTDSKRDLFPYLMMPKKQEISSAAFVILE